MAAGALEARDLSQDEINDAVKPALGRDREVHHRRARGTAPLTGHISVGVVVGPDGGILKTRVEAPCPTSWASRARWLRAPAARGAADLPPPAETVVTVPFDLHETP